MKKLACFTLVAVVFFCGFANTLPAYEGGTKLVASVARPAEMQPSRSGPLVLVPYDSLAPGKAVTGLIRRIPEPTLSATRIREGGPGQSLGTKSSVRFWKEKEF